MKRKQKYYLISLREINGFDGLDVLFHAILTLSESFNAELNFKQFSSIEVYFSLQTVKCQNNSISNNSV